MENKIGLISYKRKYILVYCIGWKLSKTELQSLNRISLWKCNKGQHHNDGKCSWLFPCISLLELRALYPREAEGKSNLQSDSLKSHLDVSSKCHILVCSEVCKMKRNLKKQEIDCKASDGANGVGPILKKTLPALILSCKYSLQNESFQQLSFLCVILWRPGCVYV